MGKKVARQPARKTSISESSRSEGTSTGKRAQEFFVADLEPHRVLDVQQVATDPPQFTFVVAFRSVFDADARKNFRLDTLDFLNERFRDWLLALFKRNLKDLCVLKKMKSWAQARLQLLKEYCAASGIEFDGLFVKSIAPPTQIYARQPQLARRPHATRGSPAKCGRVKRRTAETLPARGRRACCRSADLSFTEETHKKLTSIRSQASVLRGLQRRVQHYIAKYQGMKHQSVSREDLFRDINELRSYF